MNIPSGMTTKQPCRYSGGAGRAAGPREAAAERLGERRSPGVRPYWIFVFDGKHERALINTFHPSRKSALRIWTRLPLLLQDARKWSARNCKRLIFVISCKDGSEKAATITWWRFRTGLSACTHYEHLHSLVPEFGSWQPVIFGSKHLDTWCMLQDACKLICGSARGNSMKS